MNCPHCNTILTADEVKRLWAKLGGSAGTGKSKARSKAACRRAQKASVASRLRNSSK